MDEEKEKYFIDVQLKERELIQSLFNNYFKKRNCTDLKTTPLTGFSHYDGTFKSGNTNVVFEFKRRNISSSKFGDTFIEAYKFIELYEHHKKGNYTLFIIEYDDFYLLFDLQYEFFQYRLFEQQPNGFFCLLNASKNQFDSERKQDKQVRYLPFHQATYILNKGFAAVDYKTYLSFRATN